MAQDLSAPIIEMHGLSRHFGAVRAVEALELTIYRGEIFGLVGPDGAGKTTTLRLLAAIMDPSAGSATVAGYNTVRQSESIKRRIGYMAQQFSLYGDLSVWENLNFYADIFGVYGPDRKARIDRLIDFARLRQFKARRAINLSGGMQKKLALACTLIHQPEILLLDETTLFLHRVTAHLPEAKRQILNRLHTGDTLLEGKTVLVVDDDVRNLFALTTVLEAHRMKLTTAENGHDALKLLEQMPSCDVVLMDIMMPEMDGYETMKAIRQQTKFKSLPILALTAKAMKGDREKCLAAGANDYIAKPVEPEQLLSLLRLWLHR